MTMENGQKNMGDDTPRKDNREQERWNWSQGYEKKQGGEIIPSAYTSLKNFIEQLVCVYKQR